MFFHILKSAAIIQLGKYNHVLIWRFSYFAN